MSKKSTRRQFLQTTAAVGAGFWVTDGISAHWRRRHGNRRRHQHRSRSLNERIQVASIGVGGKGASDSSNAGRLGDMVAICDVDENTLNKKAKEFPKAKKYFDFRKLLDEMGNKIDAVTVSTPDHTHAPAAAMAMRMGIHCFCQKPMTHSLYEARTLANIAWENNLITQMGNQGTASSWHRRNVAMIKAGMVGTVKEVHTWTNRPKWPQGGPRSPAEKVPSHLKWDLWIAAAPFRPFGKNYHPFAWRGWWDFGTGALGDMACHIMAMPFKSLDLRDPISVEAQTSGHNKDSFPKWSIIRWEFPATDQRPAIPLIWYDGGKRPPKELFHGEKIDKNGSLIVGDKGILYSPNQSGSKTRLLAGAEKKEVQYKKSPGHYKEWIEGIKNGEQTFSNFPDAAGPLTETVLLGNLSVWCGKKVEWDAKCLRAKGMPELDPLIKREYRKGYQV